MDIKNIFHPIIKREQELAKLAQEFGLQFDSKGNQYKYKGVISPNNFTNWAIGDVFRLEGQINKKQVLIRDHVSIVSNGQWGRTIITVDGKSFDGFARFLWACVGTFLPVSRIRKDLDKIKR